MRQSLQFAALSPVSPFTLAWVVLTLLVIWLGWAPAKRWSLRGIPGPWGLPFLGSLHTMMARDVTLFFHDVSTKYGPVAQLWFGMQPWVVLSDATAIRKVAYKSAIRSDISIFSHVLSGEARELEAEMTLFNRGAAWKASRRAFESSVMHPERLKGHLPAIRRCIQRFMRHLEKRVAGGEAIEVKTEFGILTLAITGEVAFGVEFWPKDFDQDGRTAKHASDRAGSGEEGNDVGELLAALHEWFACLEMPNATGYLPLQILFPSLRPLWLWLAQHLPDAKQTRHMRARQKVADVSKRLMKQWKSAKTVAAAASGNGHAETYDANGHAGGGNGQLNGDAKGGASSNGPAAAPGGFREASGGISSSSFLAAMLEERQRPSSAAELEVPRMNDMQVIAQAITFIIGGYDTSSTTIAYAAFCLAANPHVQEKLREELLMNRSCLEDTDLLSQLPYLDAVLKESQRLYPVVSLLVRDVQPGVELGGGFTAPRDAIISLNVYTVHRDPAQWPQPERFLPERFLPETKGTLGPADPSAFIPFGLGARMCVGYKIATLTVKAALAALLLRYRVDLHPRQKLPLEIRSGLTVAPKDGVWVTLTELSA